MAAPMTLPTDLWKHQRAAIERADDVSEFGLFFDVGTGKTRTMIEILRRKYTRRGGIAKTLIFAPLIVLNNWKQEFAKYSKISQEMIFIFDGPQFKRVLQMEKIMQLDGAIVLTNYESLQMELLMRKLEEWRPEYIIDDESHRLKNPQSKRARKAVRLADKAEERYILTGTPILNSPMDIFMQFRILDKGQTFGTNFFAFRSRYFIDMNEKWRANHNYFPNWQPRTELYQELYYKVSTKSLRAVKSECLDLPPMVRETIEVELTREQRKAYKEMNDDLVTYIAQTSESKAAVATIALTKALRLQQIASGFVSVVDGQVVSFKENPKLDALMSLLEDYTPGSKVIVWAAFKENYRAIADRLDRSGIAYRMMTGDTPQDEREANLEAFRRDESVRVLISNQKAGGVGINLIESNVSIYFSKNFSLEDDLQSEARNYRGGSERHAKVTRIDIVAKDTLDEVITKALQEKLNMSETILSFGSHRKG